MARARNIKPGFFANELLAECDPLARILFAGLWCVADRAGRLEDRPKRIRAELLPYDSCDADALLGQLQQHGFILRYERDGQRFIQVLNFCKHQNPHVKEAKSTIPAPFENGEEIAESGTGTGVEDDDNRAGIVLAPDENSAGPVLEHDQHSTCTVPAPDKHSTNPADSGFRIPDSGFPEGVGGIAGTHHEGVPDPDLPPPANRADPNKARANEITAMLRKRGAALQAQDPRVLAWAAEGVSDAQLLTALDLAQRRRADQQSAQPVNAGFLDTLLREVTQQAADRGGGKSLPFDPSEFVNRNRNSHGDRDERTVHATIEGQCQRLA
ncbi:hypothetical protein LH442_01825 [Laribacter hongkongensis]|uniref:hypothetical protein n=1 Tax=Laribacter hongkongensis TaxID=168471 RepID=UPI001EFD03EB|nr:hypothetical protein [Laribacter hongkongensis]MCG9054740.1 hypothetical protein [Laribacter hongkongensis]